MVETMTRRNAVFVVACALLAFGAFARVPASSDSSASWKIDPVRTHIAFTIDAVGYPRTEGLFRRFEGRISIDFDHPE